MLKPIRLESLERRVEPAFIFTLVMSKMLKNRKVWLIIIATLFLVSLQSAFAGTLVDGFEDGDYDGWTVESGSASVQSTVVKNGSYAVQLHGATSDSALTRSRDGATDVYTTWIRVDDASVVNGGHYALRTSADAVIITVEVSENTFWFLVSGGWQSSGTASSDTWYKIEIHYTDNASTISAYVYDTSNTLVASKEDCAPYNTGTVGKVRIRSNNTDAYFDDVTYGYQESSSLTATVNSPNGGEVISAATTTIDFNISTTNITNPEVHVKLAYSTTQGAFENIIETDLNLNDYANISNLTCDDADFTDSTNCQYTWDLFNPVVPDGNYYIDINAWEVSSGVSGTDSSDDAFTIQTTPQITITDPENNSTNQTNELAVTYSVTSPCSATTTTIKAYLDNSLVTTTDASNTTVTVQSNKEGSHNILLTATCTISGNSKTGQDDVNVLFDLYDYNVTYSNYQTYDSNNYVHSLKYALTYRCGLTAAGSPGATIALLVNDNNANTHDLACDNSNHTINDSYTHSSEGLFNVKMKLFAADPSDNNTFSNIDFISDLNAPQIVAFDIDYNTGFLSSLSDVATAWLKCTDNISPALTYDINFNDANILDGLYSKDTNQTASASMKNGSNILRVACTDLGGNKATDLKIETINLKKFTLIDEQTGGDFNRDEADSIKAYSYAKGLEYDFKANTTNTIYYIISGNDTIRIEFAYPGDVKVTRDFNLGLLSDTNEINVCAAKYQQFYEQIFVSSSEKPIAVISGYTHCYILADYTKYAYQNALMNHAYTINMLYYLYTFDNEQKVLLASLDGTQAIVTNLDILEYKKEQYVFPLTVDVVAVSKTDENTLKIYYRNMNNDNMQITLKIYDGSTELFSHTEDQNANELTLYFDYSTLDIQNNLLKLEITKVKQTGSTETLTRYFTLEGTVGLLNPIMAAIVAVVVFFIIISLVAYRYALGYMGILGAIISLAFLTLAPAVWYITFLQAIMIISIVFIALVMKEETAAVT